MDIENGLIVYHRVYWGWKGMTLLIANREKRRQASSGACTNGLRRDVQAHRPNLALAWQSSRIISVGVSSFGFQQEGLQVNSVADEFHALEA